MQVLAHNFLELVHVSIFKDLDVGINGSLAIFEVGAESLEVHTLLFKLFSNRGPIFVSDHVSSLLKLFNLVPRLSFEHSSSWIVASPVPIVSHWQNTRAFPLAGLTALGISVDLPAAVRITILHVRSSRHTSEECCNCHGDERFHF